MTPLEKIILRAIPVNDKCAIEESYNKVRREFLKHEFELYLSKQLALHAQPVSDSNGNGLGESGHRSIPMPQV